MSSASRRSLTAAPIMLSGAVWAMYVSSAKTRFQISSWSPSSPAAKRASPFRRSSAISCSAAISASSAGPRGRLVVFDMTVFLSKGCQSPGVSKTDSVRPRLPLGFPLGHAPPDAGRGSIEVNTVFSLSKGCRQPCTRRRVLRKGGLGRMPNTARAKPSTLPRWRASRPDPARARRKGDHAIGRPALAAANISVPVPAASTIPAGRPEHLGRS